MHGLPRTEDCAQRELVLAEYHSCVELGKVGELRQRAHGDVVLLSFVRVPK